MTYDHWKTTDPADAWQGEAADAIDERELEPEPGLRLEITSTYPGRFIAHSTEMTGDGDITGHGITKAEAAADFAEQYADHEAVRLLSEAWVEINTLGGSFDPSDRRSAGYNAALGDALELLVKLGARPFKIGKRS